MAKATKAGKPNVFVRFGRYVGDVRAEMKRVVWPNREEVLNSSLVVIVTLVFFIAFTLFVDTISTSIVGFISQIGG
ncbi:MAG: preprotein translocase subunit SecE [Coriobacteriia bacterium]|nr:preprotein translocase subunit SecE [Coriobacteriia bacterium]